MNRRMIVGERIMYVDALTPVNCVFAIKIKGTLPLDGLRTALLKIQKKHPLLRTSIKENAKGVPYFVSNNALNEIPIRMVERKGDEDWKTESAKEWSQLFSKRNLPPARMVCIKGEVYTDLLLVCPHCICDGTTLVNLMSELLLLLDHPDKTLEGYSSFDSIHGLLQKSTTVSRFAQIKTFVMSVLAKVFFLIKTKKPSPTQGKNYMLHWKVGAVETNEFRASCKEANVSVHAGLSIAVMEAFKQVLGSKANGKVICPVDVRRFVEEIKADHMFAFAPIAELTLDKSEAHNFWEKARILKEELQAKIAAMDIRQMLLMSEYFHSSVKSMVKFLKTDPGSHDITLSNMGPIQIPEKYDHFEIETIYSPTVAFPWKNPGTLVVSLFKGEMDFSLCSNEGFLSKADALEIKKECLKQMVENSLTVDV